MRSHSLPFAADPAGIYLHIPFCVKKCAYCDFYSITDLALKPAFMDALVAEMTLRRDGSLPCDTLYVGGGTPSVLAVDDIDRLLVNARECFHLPESAEITLEVNPGTVTPGQLAGYRAAGVNRLNVGVQSFSDRALSFLGRIHSAQTAVRTLQWVREAGFDNVGVDLIYGLPGQTTADWQEELERVLEFAPEHLSCYMLTYESGTPLTRDRQKGLFRTLPEARAGALFTKGCTFLGAHGYAQYEISNFARSDRPGGGGKHRPDYRSRHNRKYWSFAPYMGLGPSAHSFIGRKRWWNWSHVGRYIETLKSSALPVDGTETLTRAQCMMEAVYLGFRRTDGIDAAAFGQRFGARFETLFEKAISRFSEKGMLTVDGGRCRLTPKGMLLLDSIAGVFISEIGD